MPRILFVLSILFFSTYSVPSHAQTPPVEYTLPTGILQFLKNQLDTVKNTNIPDKMKQYYESVSKGFYEVNSLTSAQALVLLACLRNGLNQAQEENFIQLQIFALFKGIGLKRRLSDAQLSTLGLQKYQGGLLPIGDASIISNAYKALAQGAIDLINADAQTGPIVRDNIIETIKYYAPKMLTFERNEALKATLTNTLATLNVAPVTPQPTKTAEANPATLTDSDEVDSMVASYILPNDQTNPALKVNLYKSRTGVITAYYETKDYSSPLTNSKNDAPPEFK